MKTRDIQKSEEIKTNEVSESQTTGPDSPILSDEALGNLKRTGKYTRVMSILYYIITALAVLGGLFNVFVNHEGPVSLIIPIGVATAFFFLGTYLQDMSSSYRTFAKQPDNLKTLEYGMAMQRSYWKLTVWLLLTSIVILPLLGLVAFVLGDFLT
jgi:hypothetical protein